jgi:hypothetical protein
MVSNIADIKTTINVDKETWNEFKRTVSSRYGSVRNLSSAVEEAIQSFNTVELLNRFVEQKGIEIEVFPSVREIEEKRPKLESSAGEAVREMRDEREARISGHQ